MIKLMLALTVLPTIASAQDSTLRYFYTRQDCAPAIEMLRNVSVYNEEPLFVGEGGVVGADGELFTGGSMFFVNQDTGTWSLMTLYPDGTACMTAFGSNFEPYTD
jgi:hypothetical protein